MLGERENERIIGPVPQAGRVKSPLSLVGRPGIEPP